MTAITSPTRGARAVQVRPAREGPLASRCFLLRTSFGERIITKAALARITDPVAPAIRGIEWCATTQAWPTHGRCRGSARFGVAGRRGGRWCEQGVIVN